MRGDPRPTTTVSVTNGMFDRIGEDLCPDPESCPVCIWFEPRTTNGFVQILPVSDVATWNDEPLIALLSADEWTTAAEMALTAGTLPQRVRDRLRAAQKRGAPIEGRRSYGYRLLEAAP